MTINERVSVLGPPRGGRIVRDAKEVIREMEEQSKKAGLEIAIEVPIAPEPRGIKPISTTPQDLFRFSDLVFTNPKQLTLYGLEVPEGTWEQISLVHEAYGDTRIASQGEWVQYSIGKTDIDPIKNIFVRKDHKPGAHIVTSKALYWFLRAAYELRNEPSKQSTIDQIRDLNPGPDRFMRNIVTAELVTQGVSPLGRQWLNISTVGWELRHPLLVDNEYYKPTPGAYAIEGNSMIEKMIYHLLGDPNASRVGKVLSWVSQSNEIPTFDIDYTQNSDEAAIWFNLQRNMIQVIPRYEPHFTLGLYADSSRFNARGGRP